MKNRFYKCVLESLFTSISGLGDSILTKKSKWLYPNGHVWQKQTTPFCEAMYSIYMGINI